MNSADKGRLAEQACCRYLQQQGLRLIEQNYRTRGGEIDLIMRDGDTLVFVEVRYRNSNAFGGAVESVTAAKQQRIVRTVQHYCQHRRIQSPVRIDIVGMRGAPPDGFAFDWVANALQAE